MKDKLKMIKYHQEKISEHKQAIRSLQGSEYVYKLPNHVAFQFVGNGFTNCENNTYQFRHDAHVVYIYKGRIRCGKCFKKKFGNVKVVKLDMTTNEGQIV